MGVHSLAPGTRGIRAKNIEMYRAVLHEDPALETGNLVTWMRRIPFMPLFKSSSSVLQTTGTLVHGTSVDTSGNGYPWTKETPRVVNSQETLRFYFSLQMQNTHQSNMCFTVSLGNKPTYSLFNHFCPLFTEWRLCLFLLLVTNCSSLNLRHHH